MDFRMRAHFWLYDSASSSNILSSTTLMMLSFLQRGQYSGKCSNTVSGRILTFVFLLHKGHSSQSAMNTSSVLSVQGQVNFQHSRHCIKQETVQKPFCYVFSERKQPRLFFSWRTAGLSGVMSKPQYSSVALPLCTTASGVVGVLS